MQMVPGPVWDDGMPRVVPSGRGRAKGEPGGLPAVHQRGTVMLRHPRTIDPSRRSLMVRLRPPIVEG